MRYTEDVFCAIRCPSRVSRYCDAGASSIARSKRAMYHASEYWYIGSMFAMSEMQKNRIDARYADDLYPSRTLSRRSVVASATTCFSAISSETFFASDKMSTAFWSSRMLP